MKISFIIFLFLPIAAWSETLIATRTIRAREIIASSDVAVIPDTIIGALRAPGQALGQEARVTLYADRPIRPGDLGPPALVTRNQMVTLIYDSGALLIKAEARALDRGAAGEVIRVMNLGSRVTLTGRIRPDGTIAVSPAGQER